MIKIGIDVGGVLSKYPEVFKLLIELCEFTRHSLGVEVHIISDMHPKSLIKDMLELNGIKFMRDEQIHSADYKTHGENCKKVLCESLGIDILIDDFVGYVAEGNFVRLLVMPNPYKPYYADSWKTDGKEGDFGRRKAVDNKTTS